MSHFLYISDVFCPWCYGFAPVMQRISSEHPGYPVRVLSGDLVENPTTTGEMMRNHPTMREFFVRLAKTTGQAVGQDFLRRLEPGQGDLPHVFPGYGSASGGAEKTGPRTRARTDGGLSIGLLRRRPRRARPRSPDADSECGRRRLYASVRRPPAYRPPQKPNERKRSIYWVIFVVYPTLFLETDDGERHVLARGYADYPVVAAKLASVLGGGASGSETRPANACGLDGHCDISA